ncbi:transcriptional regulator, LuxR family [Actinobacteria bacterium OK074]|nr:transcriptional regulator, LuxR family [Actinobacteria bacterium OK074]
MRQPLSDQAHMFLRLMLADPSITRDAARRTTGMSEQELSEAMELLTDAGMVPRLAGRGDVVTLTPDAILARLIALQEDETRERLAELERTRATLAVLSESLLRLRAENDRVSSTTRLVGRHEVSVALEGAATQARQEVLSMHPGSPLPPDMLKDSMKRNRGVIERGIGMRSIHLSTMLKVPHGRAHLEELQDAGAEVRVASVLPFRLIMIDRVVAYVPAGPTDPDTEPKPDDIAALEVRDPHMLDLFLKVFEFCWVHGATASATASPNTESAELDNRESSLLRMLGQGLKDDAIARSLGISSRTLRRMMTDLMRKLEADSRFQAGAHAVARGWLEI